MKTVPLLGVPSQGRQPEVFLCCCAGNKWLYGTRQVCQDRKKSDMSVFGEKTPKKEFLKDRLYCAAAPYMYVGDIWYLSDNFKMPGEFGLNFRNGTTVLKSE